MLFIAISGDQNYSLSGKGRGELAMSARLRMNSHRLSAGKSPREGLPPVPAGVQQHQYQHDGIPMPRCNNECRPVNEIHTKPPPTALLKVQIKLEFDFPGGCNAEREAVESRKFG
jgi:hypothetical protein